MNLKFKRYYPLIVLFVGFLSFLAFVMGNQPIITYSI